MGVVVQLVSPESPTLPVHFTAGACSGEDDRGSRIATTTVSAVRSPEHETGERTIQEMLTWREHIHA